MLIEIARDFSRTPGPRFIRLGPHSGEAFQQQLIAALTSDPSSIVEVVLDDTEGYGSSFLEEAFGGLVRSGRIEPEEIRRRLKITANSRLYKTYAMEAKTYLDDAIRIAGG